MAFWVPISAHIYSPVPGLAGRQGAPSAPGRCLPRPATDERDARERKGGGEKRESEEWAAPAPRGPQHQPPCRVLSYLTHRVHSSPCSVFSHTRALSNEVWGTTPSFPQGQKSPLGKRRRSGAGVSQERAGPGIAGCPALALRSALREARAPGAEPSSGGLGSEGLGWGSGRRRRERASRPRRAAIGQLRAPRGG